MALPKNIAVLNAGSPKACIAITQAEKLDVTLTAQPPQDTVIVAFDQMLNGKALPFTVDLIFTSADDLLDFAQRLLTVAKAAAQDMGSGH